MSKCSEARGTFKRLYQAGIRDKRQMALACGVSVHTIRRYFVMMEMGEDMAPKYKKRRAHKFTPCVRRSLVQIMAKHPRMPARWFADQLSERWGTSFSPRGVRKVLRSMHFDYGEPKRTNLTKENKQVRLNWAIDNITTDWKRVWSFDEAYFTLDPSSGRVFYTEANYHRVARRKLTSRQEKISIGIAVAISHNRKSAICYLKSGWAGKDMIDVFNLSLLPSIKWDRNKRHYRAFLIDNDGRHHNREFKAFLEEKGILGMGYLPTNSPDLNPIENVFSQMKRYVQKEAPSTEKELRQSIIDAWESLEPATLRELFRSMPQRIQDVIRNKGGRIDY